MTSPAATALSALCALSVCLSVGEAHAGHKHGRDNYQAAKHHDRAKAHQRQHHHDAAPPQSAAPQPTPAAEPSAPTAPKPSTGLASAAPSGPASQAAVQPLTPERAGGEAEPVPPPFVPAPEATPPTAPLHVEATSAAPAPPPAAEPNILTPQRTLLVQNDNVAAAGFRIWHDVPPTPGTTHAGFAQATLLGGGTIFGRPQASSSLFQAGLSLRAAYVVHPKVYLALDTELGGGGGTALGINRLTFNTGAAVGLVLPLHPRLLALPSLGLGYNLWYFTGPGGPYTRHALQLDLRAGIASPITARWSLLVAPYLQPNLVHGGEGLQSALHLTLGVSAGVVCWL